MARSFRPGDLVLGKVKGYPQWPGRITSSASNRFQITFYGTFETSSLKSTDLCPYEKETMKKLAVKNANRKFYTEAVKQISTTPNMIPYEMNDRLKLSTPRLISIQLKKTDDVVDEDSDSVEVVEDSPSEYTPSQESLNAIETNEEIPSKLKDFDVQDNSKRNEVTKNLNKDGVEDSFQIEGQLQQATTIRGQQATFLRDQQATSLRGQQAVSQASTLHGHQNNQSSEDNVQMKDQEATISKQQTDQFNVSKALQFLYVKPSGKLTTRRSQAKLELDVFGDEAAHYIIANEHEITKLNKQSGFKLVDDNLVVPENFRVSLPDDLNHSLDKIFLILENSLPELATLLVPIEAQLNDYKKVLDKNQTSVEKLDTVEHLPDNENSTENSGKNFENNRQAMKDITNLHPFLNNSRIDNKNVKLSTKEFLNQERAKNTVNANTQHWLDFSQFIHESHPEEKPDLAKIPSQDFEEYLMFYLQNVLKKKRRKPKEGEAVDSGLYNASVYTTKLNAIKRHMHFLDMPPLSEKTSTTITEIIKRRQKQSTEAGEIAGKHRALPFSREQLATIRISGQLGLNNPTALRNMVFMNFNLKFGLRPRQEMYTAKMCDIVEGPTGENGYPQWLSLSLRLRKGLRGNLVARGADDYDSKLFCKNEDPENCPVRAWIIYKSKKNPKSSGPDCPLFHNLIVMKPEKYATAQYWYGSQNTSTNSLGEIYKKMAIKSGIDPELCHIKGCTGRKLTLNSLGAGANTNPVFIAKHTGQRNLDSQMSYITPSEEQNKAMDNILSDAIKGNQINSFESELKKAHHETSLKISKLKNESKSEDPLYSEVIVQAEAEAVNPPWAASDRVSVSPPGAAHLKSRVLSVERSKSRDRSRRRSKTRSRSAGRMEGTLGNRRPSQEKMANKKSIFGGRDSSYDRSTERKNCYKSRDDVKSRSPMPHNSRKRSRSRSENKTRYGEEELKSASSVRRDYTSPPSRRDYTSPPNRRDYTSPPSSRDYTSPPNRRHYTSPPSRRDYTSPPSRRDYTSPPRSREYTSPSRRGYTSPTRRDNSSRPSRRDYLSPPRRSDYTKSYSRRNYSSPPNRRDYLSPHGRRDYTSPPKRRDYNSPIRREYTSPNRRDYGRSSPLSSRRDYVSRLDRQYSPLIQRDKTRSSRDLPSPLNRRDYILSPGRRDYTLSGRRDYNLPLAIRDYTSPLVRNDYFSPPIRRDYNSSTDRSLMSNPWESAQNQSGWSMGLSGYPNNTENYHTEDNFRSSLMFGSTASYESQNNLGMPFQQRQDNLVPTLDSRELWHQNQSEVLIQGQNNRVFKSMNLIECRTVSSDEPQGFPVANFADKVQQ